MARKYQANTTIPPEAVQQNAAEWKSQHLPVEIPSGQEVLYVELIEALVGERP